MKGDYKMRSCATRRDFLRATSALAAPAVLASFELNRLAYAAGGEEKAAAAADAAEPKVVRIRGHHLFCMLDALGTGKTSHKTLGPVANKIRANPKVSLKLVVGMDDICGPCEKWDRKKGICTKETDKYPNDNANAKASDKNAIRVLGMKPGDAMPADDLYRLIKTRVTKQVFAEKVCVACRLVDQCKQTYDPKIKAAVDALKKPGHYADKGACL